MFLNKLIKDLESWYVWLEMFTVIYKIWGLWGQGTSPIKQKVQMIDEAKRRRKSQLSKVWIKNP